MTKQNKEIAQRIQMLREDLSYSIDQIAGMLEIDAKMYSDYETGEMDFPISLLENISKIYNIELSILITGSEPKLSVYSVTRKGEGTIIKRNSEYNYEALCANFSHKKIEPFEVTIPLGEEVPIASNGHAGDEFEYVLDGTIKVIINDTLIVLNSGDSIYFDASYKHGMTAIGDKPAKIIAIVV